MNRSSILLLIVALLAFCTFSSTAATAAVPKKSAHPFRSYSKLKITPKTLKEIVTEAAAQKLSVVAAKDKAQLDLCPTCVQVTDQIISNLLNVILSGPVIGSCNKLCSLAVNELVGKLPDSALQILDVGCQLVCDYVGVNEFSKLVEMADLDPIWLCQEARLCTIHDCTAKTCAQFVQFRAIPASAPMGSTFQLVGVLQVFNQTGTGEQIIEIDPSGGMPLGDGELMPAGWAPGVYNLNWQVQISNEGQDPDDPPFEPGVYQVGMAACEGQCGSKHSHTRTLAEVFGQFTVTD